MDEQILSGKTILVVDDEVDLRDIVASEFDFMGAKVFQAENISVAQEILKKNSVDVVISDIRMPGGTGVDLLNIIKPKNARHPSMILITGFADITIEDAFAKGAEGIMNKPFKLDDLIKITARFSGSLKDRLTEKVSPSSKKICQTFQGTFEENIQGKECSIGREGVSLLTDAPSKRFEVGEVVNFDIKFSDRSLVGSGVCRWVKHSEIPNKVIVGLEFINLDDSTLSFFLKYSQESSIIPFIPALSHK